MAVAVFSLIALTLAFAIFTKILVGYAWPGYLIASALFFVVTKLILSKLQKLKYGKPFGFYQHLFVKRIAEIGLIRDKHVTRIGRWSVRRFLK